MVRNGCVMDFCERFRIALSRFWLCCSHRVFCRRTDHNVLICSWIMEIFQVDYIRCIFVSNVQCNSETHQLILNYTNLLLPNLTFHLTAKRFPLNFCNRFVMPTENAYSSRHLIRSRFGSALLDIACTIATFVLTWTLFTLLNFVHSCVHLFVLCLNKEDYLQFF